MRPRTSRSRSGASRRRRASSAPPHRRSSAIAPGRPSRRCAARSVMGRRDHHRILCAFVETHSRMQNRYCASHHYEETISVAENLVDELEPIVLLQNTRVNSPQRVPQLSRTTLRVFDRSFALNITVWINRPGVLAYPMLRCQRHHLLNRRPSNRFLTTINTRKTLRNFARRKDNVVLTKSSSPYQHCCHIISLTNFRSRALDRSRCAHLVAGSRLMTSVIPSGTGSLRICSTYASGASDAIT